MNYKESITALLEGLKGIFENKTATEASAIAQAATKPSTIFYTSDTHAIVVGGHVYGRSNQVSADAPFAYLPADVSSPSADPQFDGNHDTIYIQPIKTGADAGKIKLWWYVNGAWTSTDTLDLVLPTDAEDITYDLTNTPDLGSGDVQSAIEALDGKVEELRDEVFGDEWVDIGYGQRETYTQVNALINTSHNLSSATSQRVRAYKVNSGEEWMIEGMDSGTNTASLCYAIYNTWVTITATSSLASTYIDGDPITTAGRIDVSANLKMPSNAKMLLVSFNGVREANFKIYRKSTTPLSIADKTGYKIETWTDDEIITSTSLAVGSVVPYWSDGTRYGGRGVRLDVKEGDKILLDTYSPALFGLIFTDENRVVKALYDDRRFDGVWTAPVNGYCYIQDVLYRDNYHYASAHGHLAYMAHDARKRVAKGGDWYNEYAPRIQRKCMPFVVDMTATTNPNHFYPVKNSDGNYAITTWGAGEWHLFIAKVVFLEGQEGDITNIRLRYRASDTYTLNNGGINYITSDSKGEVFYPYAINRQSTTATDVFHTFMSNSMELNARHNFRVDYIFTHTSSDFAELYKLAQKIISGEVEVDNFYGVKEDEVDFVRNAIGLQSISDLGYNILEHGATLPIDEEGYKYAKELYERYKDNPPTILNGFFAGDTDLVYCPEISLKNYNGNGFRCFENCYNLISVQDFVKEDSFGSFSYFFRNCRSLKRVGDIKINVNGIGRAFENCYALEYIGRIATFDELIRTSEKTNAFAGCYSLERIEELNMYRWGGNNFTSGIFNNCINLRYLLIKGFGSWSVVTWTLQNALANWGIPNDKHPDARQSLVDSLLTYSYDRVNDPDELGTAGTTCTITLSANSYAQLTASEIEQITAKGYTLTHP